jgi:hypothetical protein
MKIVYNKNLNLHEATLTHDDGSDFEVLGARAYAQGSTRHEAKARLQDLLAYAHQMENRKLTQALNLVTRSKP